MKTCKCYASKASASCFDGLFYRKQIDSYIVLVEQEEFYNLPADIRGVFWAGFNTACNNWLNHVAWMSDPILWKLGQVRIPWTEDMHKTMMDYAVKYTDMSQLDNAIESLSMGFDYSTPQWRACSAAYGICLANHKDPYKG